MNTQSSQTTSPTGFDPKSYRPQRIADVQVFDRKGENPDVRYVLMRSGESSLVLSEDDYRLWQLMDGEQTISEICGKYLERYRKLVLTRAYALTEKLISHGYLRLEEQQEVKGKKEFRFNLALWLRLPVPGTAALVRLLSRVTRMLPLDNLVFQGGIWVLVLLGLLAASILPGPGYIPLLIKMMRVQSAGPLIDKLPSAYLYGLLLLFFLYIVCSLLRELWRGAVEVGFTDKPEPLTIVINYGVPGFHFPRRWGLTLPLKQRLVAGLAGIQVELLLAAVCTLFLLLLPSGSFTVELLYKLRWMLYLRCLLHLSPFKVSDLSVLFKEWSAIPHLHRRSLGFLRHNFLDTLFNDAVLSRDQRFYLAFNISLFAWTVLVTKLGVDFLLRNQQAIRDIEFIGGGQGFLLTLVLLAFLVPMVMTFFAATVWSLFLAWKWVRNQPYLKRPEPLTILVLSGLLIGLPLLAWLPRLGLMSPAMVHGLAVWLTVLGCIIGLALHVGIIRHCGSCFFSRRSVCQGALLVFFGLILLQSLQAGSSVLSPTSRLLALLILLSSLAQAAMAFGNRQDLFRLYSTPLRLPSLVSATGLLLTLLWGVSMLGISQPAGHADLTALIAVSFLVLGSAALFMHLGQAPQPAETLPPPADPEEDGENLRTVLAFIIRQFNDALPARIGRGACAVLERRINEELSGGRFSFSAGLSLDSATPEDWSRAGTVLLLTIHQQLSRLYGDAFSRPFFDLIFERVSWQYRLLLHRLVLPQTPWAQAFCAEEEIPAEQRRELLQGLAVFQNFSRNELDQLVPLLHTRRYPAGCLIIRQGDPAESCFFLISGLVQVQERDITGENRTLAILKDGDFFGESALLKAGIRLASIQTVAESVTMVLVARDFNELSNKQPELVKRIRERLATFQLLLRIPLFTDLPANLLRSVLPRVRTEQYDPDCAIVVKGDIGHEFYLIKSGKVEVLAVTADAEEHICDLGPRSYFGEIALLRDIPRTATVRAIAPTEVLVLGKEDFFQLIEGSAAFAASLKSAFEERTGTANVASA